MLDRSALDAVLLWPGAGSSSEHPSLLAIGAALAPLEVRRLDFPYRREGRRGPDRANKLILSLRADVEAVCEELSTTPERLVIGGRSMGGRMCSMAAAGATGNTAKGAPTSTEPLTVAGVVLISYPLHPPGKPERLRTEHLGDLHARTLFISGDRDAFGTPAELAAAEALVPGDVASVTIEGKAHDLKGCDEVVAQHVADWLSG